MRLFDLRYRDERGVETTRTIEPQFLYLNPPVWYLLAWDHLRNGVRALRFDRLVRASVLEQSFRLRPASVFLSAAEAGVESL
jgi:predicted DNA-binding transcriptional regulator YafY